jgi:uncharacterized protein DUF5615
VRIRLYLDEDSMDRALVRALRAREVDVITAVEAGLIARPDSQHLDYASDSGRVVFTYNVGDFCGLSELLLREGRQHSGIICAQQQSYTIGETLRRLLRLIGTVSADEMRNRVEFLSRW